MRLFIIQIISAIVLLSIVTMFSGVTLIATAESPAAIGAVNNHCNPDGAQSCPLPCTTPLCPLCICAIADTAHPIEINTNLQVFEFDYLDVMESIPDTYVSEIFHPPRPHSAFSAFVRQIV